MPQVRFGVAAVAAVAAVLAARLIAPVREMLAEEEAVVPADPVRQALLVRREERALGSPLGARMELTGTLAQADLVVPVDLVVQPALIQTVRVVPAGLAVNLALLGQLAPLVVRPAAVVDTPSRTTEQERRHLQAVVLRVSM